MTTERRYAPLKRGFFPENDYTVSGDWHFTGTVTFDDAVGDFDPSAHAHSADEITSGQFADSLIAESNVTQHQAALSIAYSQLTGVPAAAAVDWDDIVDKPSTFPPSSHTHDFADLFGEIVDDHLSDNVALLDRDPQTFSGENTFEADVVFEADVRIDLDLTMVGNIYNSANNTSINISGGLSANAHAHIELFGPTHATLPYYIYVAGNPVQLRNADETVLFASFSATTAQVTATTVDINGDLDIDGTTHNIDGTTITIDAATTLNLNAGSTSIVASGTTITTTTSDLRIIDSIASRLRLNDSGAVSGQQSAQLIYNDGVMQLGPTADGWGIVENCIRVTANTSSEITLTSLFGDEIELNGSVLLDFNGNLDLDGTTHTLDGTTITVDAVTTLNLAGGSATATLDGTEVDLTATTLDFNGNADISGTTTLNSDLTITNSTAANFYMIDPDAGVDSTRWRQFVQGTNWTLTTRTDANGAGNNAIAIGRTGTTVSSMVLTSSSTSITGGSAVVTLAGTEVDLAATTLDFNGDIDADGTTLDIDGATSLTLHGGSTDLALSGTGAQLTGNLGIGIAPGRQLHIGGVGAVVRLDDTSVAVDEKVWLVSNIGAVFRIDTRTDIDGTGMTALRMLRTGTVVNEIEFNATLFDFNGLADFSEQVRAPVVIGYYSPGTFTVATEQYANIVNHLKLTSNQRATIEGTGRLDIR